MVCVLAHAPGDRKYGRDTLKHGSPKGLGVLACATDRVDALERPDLEFAKVPLEDGRRFVAVDKSVNGSGDRLGHPISTAELNACGDGSLRDKQHAR